MAWILGKATTSEVEQLERAQYDVDYASREMVEGLLGRMTDDEWNETNDRVPYKSPGWEGYIRLYVDCEVRHLLYPGLVDGLMTNGFFDEAHKILRAQAGGGAW